MTAAGAVPGPRTAAQAGDTPGPGRVAPAAGLGPEEGLHAHAAALHERARRLRESAAALGWRGPEADAFRERVERLADRCAAAARDLTRSAALLRTGPAADKRA
ncbi:hypothetical protein LG634_19025 [Streptomyces bambusae]|uniref:hypothetical protein n=1 Tax=Streptomyces bambusae TaxID=1550616 RepID=UPI001CFE2002|nr:hypothetical protein [Streptomyces bambusae]MCB5166926.1 hypothetical protein [Streptomyces bambusae]